MKFIKRLKIFKPSQLLLIALLCIISIIVTAYAIRAHSIATRYVHDGGDEVAWVTLHPAPFFLGQKNLECYKCSQKSMKSTYSFIDTS